jgi:hypothetical protein
MPKHTQVINIEITPERFLENCSADELKELDFLIQQERYQMIIRDYLRQSNNQNIESVPNNFKTFND